MGSKGSLRCFSFHSVKGGVGKSTLSSLCAASAAATGDRPVTLIDVDLTGTSLSDVLPLRAPVAVEDADGRLDLTRPPTGFHGRFESRQRIEDRGAPDMGSSPRGVPYLNDFLLYQPQRWEDREQLCIDALEWDIEGGDENLKVIPSSALPADLEEILPVVYDEEHSAFLESRLEHLLAAIAERTDHTVVVLDTPPAVPGLSRSVLSLAIRLGLDGKRELSADGGTPQILLDIPITWTAFLVLTPDVQDLRAGARWLDAVGPDEEPVVRVVINKAPDADPTQRDTLLQAALAEIGSAHSLFGSAAWVPLDPELGFFEQEGGPPPEAALDFLDRLST